MINILFLSLLFAGCSLINKPQDHKTGLKTVQMTREIRVFSRGEIILASELLNKIFDQEMAPISCVPDIQEASLLLRTLQPRLDEIEDDLSSRMDDPAAVAGLIGSCEENCTCFHVSDLFREHLVPLTKTQKLTLSKKMTPKEQTRCFTFIKETFCKGDLYKALNSEKGDFSFEDSP